MIERAEEIKRAHFFFTECFGQPIVVLPKGEMERLCEYTAMLEAENRALRERVRELEAETAKYDKPHVEWLERKLQLRIENNAELIERVRELERQRAFLVDRIVDNQPCFMPREFGCSERHPIIKWDCNAEKYMKEACVLDRAEEAAKEAE